jgi:hypothetical protein
MTVSGGDRLTLGIQSLLLHLLPVKLTPSTRVLVEDSLKERHEQDEESELGFNCCPDLNRFTQELMETPDVCVCHGV